MVWINIGIIVLALVGLGVYGFILYKKSMKSDIKRVTRLTERFQIRINVIQGLVEKIKQHVDAVTNSVKPFKELTMKIKDDSLELKDATVGLTKEVKRTVGIDSTSVSTESKM